MSTQKNRISVEAVYCISLENRTDRRELFLNNISEIIENPINFHIVERNENPVKGCYESHQFIAKLALEKGYKNILIFEDDAQAYKIRKIQIRWINRFILKNNFEIMHLGYTMGKIWLTWHPFIARSRVVALHAYILSNLGCQKIASTPFDGLPIDVFVKNNLKQHSAFPMLFRQHAASITGSDIEKVIKNEDIWWQKNWNKHILSAFKNSWKTLLRINF